MTDNNIQLSGKRDNIKRLKPYIGSEEEIDQKIKDYVNKRINEVLKDLRLPEDQIDFDPISGHNHDGDDSKKPVITVDGDAIDQE